MVVTTEDHLMQRLRRVGPWFLAGLCLYWFLPTWIWHIRRTMDPFAFNDDARILIWPFLREADPNIFPNDPFAAYYLAGLPEGFLALYRVVGRFGWTKVTSEVLPYVSVLSVVFLLAVTARRLGGVGAAFLAVVLVLGSASFFDRAGGGLPRTFAFPLVSAGLYALATARPKLLALLTVAGAAFYPVVAALLGLSLFLLLVLPARLRTNAVTTTVRVSSLRSRALLVLVTLVSVAVLLAPMALRLRAYGDPITPAMLTAFPEAGPGGRLTPDQHPPYPDFASIGAHHARAALLGTGEPIGLCVATWLRGNDKRTNLIVTMLVAMAAVRVIARSRQRPELVRPSILLLAALLGHMLACLLAPRLFLPERYAQFGVPPFVVLLVATGFGDFGPSEPRLKHALLLRGVAAALLLGVLGGKGTSWIGIEVYLPPIERPLYAALAQLPRTAVIAGWPAGPTENIPYLSERRVLTNFQLEMPFHTQFTLDSRARLSAFFEGYFATRREPIERLCSEFHVTHLLIDPKHFAGTSPDYYAPHGADVARLFLAAQAKTALAHRLLAHSNTRHFDLGVGLVDLSRIPELAPACSGGRGR